MRHRLDLIEVALLAAVVGLVAWFGGRAWQQRQPYGDGMLLEGQQQNAAFARRYGPDHNSRNEEEWIIRDFFHDQRGRFFLDVGSAYYRPQTRFFSLFVSDVSDATVDFYVPGANLLEASSTQASAENSGDQATIKHRVATTTLNALLDHEHVAHVDFVSLDIELAEPKALAGFDVERFAPALLCVEVHPEVRQAILDYFHRHHYEVVGKYIPSDRMNFYFMPDRLAAAN